MAHEESWATNGGKYSRSSMKALQFGRLPSFVHYAHLSYKPQWPKRMPVHLFMPMASQQRLPTREYPTNIIVFWNTRLRCLTLLIVLLTLQIAPLLSPFVALYFPAHQQKNIYTKASEPSICIMKQSTALLSSFIFASVVIAAILPPCMSVSFAGPRQSASDHQPGYAAEVKREHPSPASTLNGVSVIPITSTPSPTLSFSPSTLLPLPPQTTLAFSPSTLSPLPAQTTRRPTHMVHDSKPQCNKTSSNITSMFGGTAPHAQPTRELKPCKIWLTSCHQSHKPTTHPTSSTPPAASPAGGYYKRAGGAPASFAGSRNTEGPTPTVLPAQSPTGEIDHAKGGHGGGGHGGHGGHGGGHGTDQGSPVNGNAPHQPPPKSGTPVVGGSVQARPAQAYWILSAASFALLQVFL